MFLVGILGVGLILFAFIMIQLRIWSERKLNYNFVNLIGGVLLAIYSISLKNIPFFILQLVWSIVALIKIIWIFRRR